MVCSRKMLSKNVKLQQISRSFVWIVTWNIRSAISKLTIHWQNSSESPSGLSVHLRLQRWGRWSPLSVWDLRQIKRTCAKIKYIEIPIPEESQEKSMKKMEKVQSINCIVFFNAWRLQAVLATFFFTGFGVDSPYSFTHSLTAHNHSGIQSSSFKCYVTRFLPPLDTVSLVGWLVRMEMSASSGAVSSSFRTRQ